MGEAAVSEGEDLEGLERDIDISLRVKDELEAGNHSEGNENGSEYHQAAEESDPDSCEDADGKMENSNKCKVCTKDCERRIRRCKRCRGGCCCSITCREGLLTVKHENMCGTSQELGSSEARKEVLSTLSRTDGHRVKVKLKDELVNLVGERMLPILTSRCV